MTLITPHRIGFVSNSFTLQAVQHWDVLPRTQEAESLCWCLHMHPVSLTFLYIYNNNVAFMDILSHILCV